MNDIISFFKEIFMMKSDDKKVGLSQFKKVTEPISQKPKKTYKKAENIKISDLMRGSY